MKKTLYFLLALQLTVAFISCSSSDESATPEEIATEKDSSLLVPKSFFEDTVKGKKVHLFYLENRKFSASITNYGGRIVNFIVPDSSGKPTDIAIGFGSLSAFTKTPQTFFGAIVGRYANRIAGGKFMLNGKPYTLPINNEPNSLHGGPDGFHNVVWDGIQTTDTSLQLTYNSKDGEMGYPGNLYVKVIYTLRGDGSLKIDYEALTNKPTICNLSNHTYFNLNGEGTINKHLLAINAAAYTPVDATLIPTGKFDSVSGTPFDFRQPHTIGERVNQKNTQLQYGRGYDHNFILNKDSSELSLAAEVKGDKSGIIMKLYTTEPGLQFYGGNFMAGKNELKNDTKDAYRTAFCLEPQHYPDSPNHPDFPSTVLNPGDVFKSTTIYKFSVAK